jgi:RNA polymerase sigma factor (sigma-70 family)
VANDRTNLGMAHLLRAACARGAEGRTDGHLLAQFLALRDEAAFAALVKRHGPMVLGVCRRALGNAADAEDAFQATFLVLVRRAAALRSRAVLGDWLHGVARRTALSARRAAARRRAKEQAVARPETQGEEVRDDWLPLLDEELTRLPGKYRLPLVLCDLEGTDRREAARRLGWPEGTVAGRLARGRALLAGRLTRRGVALSAGPAAVLLSQNAAPAAVPAGVVESTARGASELAGGTGVLSAEVAGLTEGVVRAMFLTKLKAVTCALGLTVLVAAGGLALCPSGPTPTAAARGGPMEAHDGAGTPKPGPTAEKLVRQLGSPDFAERQAAEKALAGLGARAAAAVRAGMRDTDPEVARRCEAVWPRLWQAEVARPSGYAHPLWDRFRKAAGDGPDSRALFAEMVADVRRYGRLGAVEADPARAGAAYADELKQRVEALKRGYQEAEAKARGRTGILWPSSGTPTRGEFVTLLFLGTYPATAAVTFREAGDSDRVAHHNVFGLALHPSSRGKDAAIPPALRRLFAAWLATRANPNPARFGMNLALYHSISEVGPAARARAADAALDPQARGFALLAVGRFGGAADLPLLEKAFDDTRVFHATRYTSEAGKQRPVEAQVGDAAVAAALRLAGQHPADFGFPLLEMYKERGPDTLAKYHLLGFFDGEARAAAHKKAKEWFGKHRAGGPAGKPPPGPAGG